MVGTLRTSKENCIRQLSSGPNVDKRTLVDGVNVTIPVPSGALIAKVTHSQAPAVPIAVGLNENTPGSGAPHGTAVSPQLGQNRMAVSSSTPGRLRSGRLMDIVPVRPLSKIATGLSS